MKESQKIRKFHIDDKGYSLIELVVVIAIMIAVVGIISPMLYNGPSNKTRQDVETFNSMIGKNAVYSMAKQNRALELKYDSTKGCYCVSNGVLTPQSGSSTTYSFAADDIQTLDKNETIRYYLYGDPDSTPKGSYLTTGAAGANLKTLDQNTKVYFILNKTKGNFDYTVFTNSAGGKLAGHDYSNRNIKYVYFTIKNATRGCRLYKDTGKHDVFKQ